MEPVGILGSTGSIGAQALRVCRALGRPVVALSADKSTKLLEEQARAFLPKKVCVTNEEAFRDIRVRLQDTGIQLLFGMQGLCEIAADPACGMPLNALVGMVGLRPTLAALEAGKTVALANKETLVAAGELVQNTAKQHGGSLLPVDSEHSAIFQCLHGNDKKAMRRILLTASGGPFYGQTREQLQKVTLSQALCHPNWSMGKKITVDSATLMNKGLELIEAMWLFDAAPSQIEILIHRQSLMHSAVEYTDGSIIAQLSRPDMALPILLALTWPERVDAGVVAPLDLIRAGTLSFAAPDEETFGCLRLAKRAAEAGGLAPCILNAANEAAVALFLEEKIGFLEIEERVGSVLERLGAPAYQTLEEVLSAAEEAKRLVLSASSHY
ncbi:MAG: 1-deoxy-D-xylulose-5-phosphate reductoisomerase [Provencibacterium sp.]|jgi:1-deoxy-D-xylulose-5-phosphate reductoisomerase|nr:1-deoxy-D-xylulose-5-phosphate reductoisomerase [Provencibacterium sp.]